MLLANAMAYEKASKWCSIATK